MFPSSRFNIFPAFVIWQLLIEERKNLTSFSACLAFCFRYCLLIHREAVTLKPVTLFSSHSSLPRQRLWIFQRLDFSGLILTAYSIAVFPPDPLHRGKHRVFPSLSTTPFRTFRLISAAAVATVLTFGRTLLVSVQSPPIDRHPFVTTHGNENMTRLIHIR